MDEFSEQLIVNKPIVYISVSELLNTHKVSRSRTKTLWVQKVPVVPGRRH